jgi:hypothetical protein
MSEAFAGLPYSRQNFAGDPAAAQRDYAAEQDHAEWRGWAEAQGYAVDDGYVEFDNGDMRDAFTAGMQAARDLDAAAKTAERARIKGLFDQWITITMSEPNSHPPEAWIAAFADLICDKPQFRLADEPAAEEGLT